MKLNLVILFSVYVISWCMMAIGYSATASVGHYMSPTKAYILLPLIMQVFGACLIAVPASRLMTSLGRKKAFMFGSCLGVLGGLLCVYSLYISNFWLLVVSTLFIGMFNGFGEFIKYAAAEMFDDDARKNRAIAVIVSGGIVAAFIGPSIASYAHSYFNWFGAYTGPYIVVVAFCFTSLVLFSFYVDVTPTGSAGVITPKDSSSGGGNVVRSSVLANPSFILGSAMGVIAYLIMGIMMDAFSITMLDHGMEFGHTTSVLQWHMLAMFAPSVVTSIFLSRFGFSATAVSGIVMNLLGIAFALEGKEFFNFLGSLFFIGLGWNFMYIAGTSVIANLDGEIRKPAEGYNNLLITAAYAIAAPLAAFIVLSYGWDTLSLVALLMALVAAFFVIRFRSYRAVVVEIREPQDD
jgi:MFS family permease